MEHSTLNKSAWSQAIILILSILALAGAYLSQFAFDLYPCTYCIVARYVISFIAVFSMIGTTLSFMILNTPSMKLRNIRILSQIHLLMSFIVGLNIASGIYFSIKHYIVVFENNFSCGKDALQEHLNSLFLARIWPSMYEATGNCVDANYKLFNLIDYVHLPMMMYVIFLILIIYSIVNSIKFNSFLKK